MEEYKFIYPIQVRYGDLDAQWHVNNARFLTFLEQARFAYLVELGIFDGSNFLEVPFIVADIHVAYLAPIHLTQKIEVRMRVGKMGNKSLRTDYLIVDSNTGQELASAEIVMVAYDYHTRQSMPIADSWRKAILDYEGRSLS
jgi:acyl-CoA thioester hydrolase